MINDNYLLISMNLGAYYFASSPEYISRKLNSGKMKN